MAVLDKVFQAAIKLNASDIHIAPGEPFIMRKVGKLVKTESEKFSHQKCKELIFEILTDRQKEILKRDNQLDFVYAMPEARFRGNTMMHQRGLSASFRVVPLKIPTLSELNMPETVLQVLNNHQGLILVTGPAGQGKSTTLAAMVDHINTNRSHHILTVEDPIEFVHPLKKGVVNQRQLGRDTLSYSNSLKAALRENPDVIMVGELRDLETIALAISASETGHLVIGTLSSSSAPKTVERIINSYPPNEQNQIRAMLSESLKAVITQRLIPNADNTKMELALEILIGSLPVANLIRDNKVFQIQSIMQTGKSIGMQIMDESILALLKDKKITVENAIQYANNKNIFHQYLNQKN